MLTYNSVVWFEIGSPNTNEAKHFYNKVFSWKYELDTDSSIDGQEYTRIIAPEAHWPMGAMFKSQQAESNLSILVKDIQSTLKAIEQAGGNIVVPFTQIGDVTSFARFTDPMGNLVSVFTRSESEKYKERIEASEEAIIQSNYQVTPGMFHWFEISSTDITITQRFYSEVFGWSFVQTDSPTEQDYYLIMTGGEYPNGGIHFGNSNYFAHCIKVMDVEQSKAIIKQAGGSIIEALTSPNLIYARCADNQGNQFMIESC